MAISVARVLQGGKPHTITGAGKKTITDVTLDDDYTTGGKAITAAQLGMSVAVTSATAEIKTPNSAGVNVVEITPLPQTDGSVLLFAQDETPAQLSSSADLTAMVARVTAYGA